MLAPLSHEQLFASWQLGHRDVERLPALLGLNSGVFVHNLEESTECGSDNIPRRGRGKSQIITA